jgi:hypothetical protein
VDSRKCEHSGTPEFPAYCVGCRKAERGLGMKRCENPWESCGGAPSHRFESTRVTPSGFFIYGVNLCPEHLAEELSGGIGYDRTVLIEPIK